MYYNNLQDASKRVQEMYSFNAYESINDSSWIKWIHEGVPDEPEWLREILRNIFALFGHCSKCTSLSGCFFADRTEKCPEHPLHPSCHCTKSLAGKPLSSADCPIEKFTKYIFADKYAGNGKRKLFEQLGFNAEDSQYLQQEFQKQAKERYVAGDYTLGLLDSRGQRISISVLLANQERGMVKFVSGWMVRPNGYITCNTPLGG